MHGDEGHQSAQVKGSEMERTISSLRGRTSNWDIQGSEFVLCILSIVSDEALDDGSNFIFNNASARYDDSNRLVEVNQRWCVNAVQDGFGILGGVFDVDLSQ